MKKHEQKINSGYPNQVAPNNVLAFSVSTFTSLNNIFCEVF